MNGVRIPISLVIDMTAAQVQAYVNEYGLPHHDGPLRTRDIVDHVRESVLSDVQGSAGFGDGGATVTIKGR